MELSSTHFLTVSKVHVIERKYQKHRESLLKAKSSVYCHEDNDQHRFMAVNQRKVIDSVYKKLQIERSNAFLNERLRKIEQSESLYAKERRIHMHHILPMASYRRKLNHIVSNHRLAVVRAENKHVAERISKVEPQPEHVSLVCRDWYAAHEKFRSVRTKNVTGGHLMHIPKALAPESLHAYDVKHRLVNEEEDWIASLCAESHSSVPCFNSSSSTSSSSSSFISAMRARPSTSKAAQRSIGYQTTPSRHLRSAGGLDTQSTMSQSSGRTLSSRKGVRFAREEESLEEEIARKFSEPQQTHFSFVVDEARREKVRKQRQQHLVSIGEDVNSPKSPASVCSPILSSDCMKAEDNPASEVSAVRVVPFLDPSDEAVAASTLSDQMPEAYLPTSYSLQPPSSSTASKALHVVLSWNFPFPHQPKNCRVEVCVKPRNDVLFAEALHLRVMYQALLITESIVSIDQAFELTNLIKYMPQAVDDSAAHHQAILRNMFFEHDIDKNGTLSYSELERLLSVLGVASELSHDNLLCLISEADVDVNGSIDYEEFVTIAAPMLQTFRAKSLANVCHYDKAIEAVVESSISRDELARLADDCILMLKQSDTIHAGALPAHIIKRKLQKVAALALSANEISMLVQNLPRTSSGLCLYESIRLIIYDVRFQSLKAIILDSQTSDIQQEVSRRFTIEMKRFSKQRIDATPENYGLLPVRVVVDILLNLAAFPLSRLQVIMIINEATIVDEKYINLHHFAPVASRFIEQLFDPNVIKPSHAFESSGSSSKGKDGTSAVDVDDANDMRSKLLLLFQAYDLDFNGVLSYQELLDCVNSLDLALSSAQIQGLVACAFTNPQEEELSFDQFSTFFIANVAKLLEAKQASEKLQTPNATLILENEAFLKVLYLRISEGSEGTIFYGTMCTLLQTVLPLDSCCFRLMIALVCSVDKLVVIDDAIKLQGRILMLFGYNVADFLTKSATAKTTRRRFRHSLARTVIEEDAISLVCLHLASTDEWTTQQCASLVTQSLLLSCADDRWLFEVKRELLWSALQQPGLSLTAVEGGLIFEDLERRSQEQGWLDRADLTRSIIRARQVSIMWGVVDDETSEILYQKLLDLFIAKRQLAFDNYDKEAPSYVSTEDCFRVMYSASSFLRLTRMQIFFLIYWSDCLEKDGHIVKYKRLIKFTADAIIHGFRSLPFLESYLRLFKQGLVEMQAVVQEDALVQFLHSEFESGSTRNSEEVSGIPRQDVERSFRRLHTVQLTNDESSILVASCCAEEDACDGNYVQRQTLVREAYQSMSVLFLVRYIGRRLSVLYSNAEGESMLYIPTFPLKKLAERLLHVVRLVGSSGNNKGSEITIKFPDPAEYMAMDQNEQQTDANSLACKNNVTMRAIDAKTSIRVTGHSRMTEMPVTLSFSIENSVRRSNASAILTLVSDLGHELKAPASITFGIPSNMCADEEEAEKYLCSIAGSFVLHCEQDTFTYLELPPPTTTLL